MKDLVCYEVDSLYTTKVAYFSMEFAIEQSLKIYSGGLGFLAGSHIRSAFDLEQHMTGVGLLWSYGYYDQGRNEDRSLHVEHTRKFHYFLEDPDITVMVNVNGKPVHVKVMILPCHVFGSAPMILLSTDIPENDFLSRTITHKLYDGNEETRVAQEIVLGIGGVRALEALNQQIDIYHMNEGHALPLVFELLNRYDSVEELREHVVFTTHTPEKAGNEEHNAHFLAQMGFFNGYSLEVIQKKLQYYDENFSLTVGALKVSKRANAVSKIHENVANEMWKNVEGRCEIIGITNAQNRRFWTDKPLIRALEEHEDYEVIARKKHLKKILFEEVADQTGKVFSPDVITIVWARRFAEYKRPGLLKYDVERFDKLLKNTIYPVQVIWAGKPYPGDVGAINMFNELIELSHSYKNMAVLIGYEIKLSKMLKQGSDIWLNTPRVTREASGTSGMTASMNGSIHFSINDGWHPEFAKDGVNAFSIDTADASLSIRDQDNQDHQAMMDKLENVILPLYYNDMKEWVKIMKYAMNDVMRQFDSSRMVHQYYKWMYNFKK
jgi:starch phosphorylase